MATDYIVKDIALAGYGRKELDIAETGKHNTTTGLAKNALWAQA